MRYFLSLLLLVLIAPVSWSQKTEQYAMEYSTTALEKVLEEVEKKFDIKYSYVDSIVVDKKLSLPFQNYSLQQLHAAIQKQTFLKIVQIDQRYYSIYDAELPLKEAVLQEVLVSGFLTKGINKVGQKITVSPQKMEALPGVTDADVLASLQQLPGVKSPNETASGLHIRGGTADQNLILWDGIRMYHPGHLFGMISGFNPNVTQSVNYYNKGTSPKYGERIASVIAMESSDKITKETKGTVGLNALNADAYFQIPLVKNKLGLQIAGRKSYTEQWQTPTFTALATKVFQNTNFKNFNRENRFEFEDYSAKLNFKLSDKTDLSVETIRIENDLNFNSSTGNTSTVNQTMAIINQGYSGHWKQRYSEKLTQKMNLYYSNYTFDYDKKQLFSATTFESYRKLNRITDSGLEWNLNYDWNQNLSFEVGYQYAGNAISHSFTSATQGIKVDLDQRQGFTTTHSGFGNANYALPTWNFQIGTRYNYFSKSKLNTLEPRIFIQKNLSDGFLLQFTYEKKSQIVSQVRESVSNDLSLENYVWIVADNHQYPIQKAQQYSAGFLYKVNSWLMDVDSYYKTITGITSLTFGFLHQYDSALHKGVGYTKGLDVLIQKSAPTWKAWLTYTFQDSQNKYDGINGNRYFAINSDSKHAFNLSFSKKWKHYSIAMGWFWHTGRPYSLLNASNTIASFNTERLPAYHRLDFSGAYQFQFQKSWTGKVGIAVYNAYNQHTVISKEYERQYSSLASIIQSKYVIKEYYSLGFTPNVFVRVAF